MELDASENNEVVRVGLACRNATHVVASLVASEDQNLVCHERWRLDG